MIVPYSCIIHSNLFTSGTLDAGRRILELHLTRQLSVHVDCDIPHRKDVHFARNKVSQTDRTRYSRQNASVRHVCKYHCLRQVYLLPHDSIRKRHINNDKHMLHVVFFGWDGGCSTLYFSCNMVKTKINHVLIDNDVIANQTHYDSHYKNCTIGIL
jgi:hypothetical protein